MLELGTDRAVLRRGRGLPGRQEDEVAGVGRRSGVDGADGGEAAVVCLRATGEAGADREEGVVAEFQRQRGIHRHQAAVDGRILVTRLAGVARQAEQHLAGGVQRLVEVPHRAMSAEAAGVDAQRAEGRLLGALRDEVQQTAQGSAVGAAEQSAGGPLDHLDPFDVRERLDVGLVEIQLEAVEVGLGTEAADEVVGVVHLTDIHADDTAEIADDDRRIHRELVADQLVRDDLDRLGDLAQRRRRA